MMIGKRLSDRYKILHAIGGGGMANVYLAHDIILDRDVAVKILRIDLADESNLIRRFQREAQSATSLVHPNIVSVYDVGEENDLHYIVMEHVDGMDLKQYIHENHPISYDKAVDIMLQIVSAVAIAHQHHIIHRDLKPQNILIDHDGVVKITDFGIAMALSETSITQTNSLLGSVHYLSPEQARGGMATQKSDIYSLGIVLYELLTGKVPFDGESAVSIAIKHLQADIPSARAQNPEIPQSLENIIIKATAKDPFLRYQNAEEMEKDLQTCLNPDRLNEPKYVFPTDDGDTKAIPIIATKETMKNLDKTIVPEGKVAAAETTPDEKKGKKKMSKKKKIAIIVSSVIAIFAIAILLLWLLGKSPDEVAVPDVSGKTEDQAVALLQKEGFVIGKTAEKNSDEVAEGKVINTDPAAGDMKEKGTKINLFVSIGSKKITMENYTGRSYTDTKALLEQQGFKNISSEEAYSSEVGKGMIISQTPTQGTEVVAKSTNVKFVVSKGAEPITLKDLRGYTKTAVEDYASSLGLKVSSKEENSDSVEKGQVISQSPSAGSNVSAGDTIEIVISAGPKEKQVKEVTKTFNIAYTPSDEENPQPQKIQIYIQDKNHSMTSSYRELTITQNTSVEITFQIEEGSSAGYKIMSDGKVIDEGTVPYPK
ncbi:Stk1 family PASTA domain-containing Ser/Thr kinase [Listeria cossartiae subsp. cayugensis]|uniref:Stk1 family PASTA domain-containing Ser/Thr kinase n=1 Tax=Listeria cossartiae TaxID=2838249 RepID=UPI002880BD1E|nr:Stk1 family PASTA domain-containing Ser/Thr kinase [Listeria cossartiae]MDT0000146.1 Stk1 family PASTA domain-containing Ser/Thr kinase [Listeria cossartiae subsp. cayugensis]MDT0008766.1 Stk1 family PASTA domain-containing Ser/Thr kinase [Listeria cossartiae subsp. cayugensis]MDT0030598.1 Stk1 family PASTA domain-containing Ser/Thr kinase [Listeria cossartiae subsp. cayugensis]MDT0038292.1 Stk1 family PASTA domain-containing Ser/Thr kinase [Listeria cossartiae subsp. cayugensis]MDT0043643.